MAGNYVAYAAPYDDVETAEDDFVPLREAGLRDITATLVTKSDSGRLHVHEKTHAGKVGAAAGVIGVAVLGAIFPPAGVALAADGVVGGASLGVIGYLRAGIRPLPDIGCGHSPRSSTLGISVRTGRESSRPRPWQKE